MFSLDFINTVAFGGVILFGGHFVRRLIPALARYNVPAPVIGAQPESARNWLHCGFSRSQLWAIS